MTAQEIANYKPTFANGKVVLDESVYKELRKAFFRAQVLNDIAESEQQIRDGKTKTYDEVFGELQRKYKY